MKYKVLQYTRPNNQIMYELQNIEDEEDTYSSIPCGDWSEYVGQIVEEGIHFRREYDDCGNHTCKCSNVPEIYLNCHYAIYYAYPISQKF